VHVTTGGLRAGFVSEPLRLAMLTEAELSGTLSSTKDMSKMPSRRRAGIDPITLKAGDAVVHEQHGVGRFVEMTSRTGRARPGSTWSSSTRRQARAPADRLYVPTDQLDEVTRYVGGEAPSLHRLGGADWAKTKGRARKAVREIAAELIRLYSARMAARPGTRSARTRPGSASWRTRSPTETPTSSPPSTRSSTTWRSRCRWTG
jgi:transcription-repair coupling factor (superfamily II helicase)